MTKRPTRRAVPLAIACAWLACALPAAAAPGAPAVPASAPAAQSSAASAATQYTVKPGQSLADIAASVTGSHDKTVLGRAARSIFDANPSAFMRNDPSLLKLGAVLNVPALDATGAVAKAEPAPAAASTNAPASAPASAAASQAAAATGTAGAKPAAVPAAKGASAPAAAISPASASAATGAPASAPASAVSAPAKAAPASHAAAAHPPVNGATGEHAWSGAIQPAPAAPASAEASASASASAAAAASAAVSSGGAAASGSVAASAPAAAVGEAPASAAASAAGPAPASTSMPKPSAAASSVAAPAVGASHPKVSSLQQLLTLKNRVLMELQRHGFGGQSAAHPGATAGAPAGASGFAAPPASGAVATAAPGASRTAAAANQRFIGIGDYGFSLTRNAIAAVAAIGAAIVAALLVVLIALGMGRRRRRAPATAGAANGSAASTASPSPGDDAAQAGATAVAAAPDDPVAAEFLAILARNPSSKRALMGLAAHYAERKNAQGFDEIAQRIYRLSSGRGPNWVHIAAIGRELDPDNPLYALDAGGADEAVLSPDDDAQVPVAPAPDGSPAASPSAAPAPSDAELHAAVSPAEAPARPAEGRDVPPETDAPGLAGRSSTDEPSIEEAAAEEAAHAEPELHEPATSEPAAAAAPEGEATLPPDAMAALGGLEIGLPPRVGAGPESPVHPAEPEPGELEEDGHGEPVPERTADAGASMHEAATAAVPPEHADEKGASHESHESHEAAPETQAPPAVPAAAPAVTGLGAAPVGRLNLSFDLDLPGAQAGEAKGGGEGAGADEQGDISPVPQFTPEQLARIARNKLDLAAEYIALGDLGGARTLIHEVIDSNDAATHDEAHAMLATLAPLS